MVYRDSWRAVRLICIAACIVVWMGGIALAARPGDTLCRVKPGDTGVNRWKALVLNVAQKPPVLYGDDYCLRRNGYGWDFTDSKAVGRFDVRNVKDMDTLGGLRFQTTSKTAIVRGNVDSKDQYHIGDESIGGVWSLERLPFAVRVEMEQSRMVSDWTLVLVESVHGKKKFKKIKGRLKGAGKKTLVFHVQGSKSVYTSFAIQTSTAGNRIKLSKISIERRVDVRYFRTKLNLKGAPEKAVLSLNSNGSFRLYVNGNLVDDRRLAPPANRRQHTYRGALGFRKGANVVCVEVDLVDRFYQPGNDYFFLEGAVYQSDGSIKPIFTQGKTWKGTYRHQKGWERIEFDDSQWPNAASRKKDTPNRQGLTAYGKDGRGYFFTPPYLGRIDVRPNDKKYPFFQKDELVSLRIDVFKAPVGSSKELKYEYVDGEDVSRKSGTITFDGNGAAHLQTTGLPAGVYDLKLTLTSLKGKEIDRRCYEVVVCGPLKRPETESIDLMSLLETRLVSKTNLSDASMLGRIISGGRNRNEKHPIPRITQTAAGPALTGSLEKGSWFGFEVGIKTPGAPHLIEVDYPDDGNRHMMFFMAESPENKRLGRVGKTRLVVRAATGIFTGDDQQKSNGLKTYRFIYYPLKKKTLFGVVNLKIKNIRQFGVGLSVPKKLGELKGSSISAVRIHEITGDLPVFKPSHGEKGKVAIGPFSERVDRTIAQSYYTGELGHQFGWALNADRFQGAWRGWYNAYSNLIDHLRFIGQNTFFAGIYMYYGGLLDSADYHGSTMGEDVFPFEWKGGFLELMAEMFEANGMDIYLGVQYLGSNNILKRAYAAYEDDVDMRFMTRNGVPSRGLHNRGFNFMHPVVREDILGLAKNIREQFSAYPAVKGVTWMRLPEYRVGNNAPKDAGNLHIGYGDRMVGKFESEVQPLGVADSGPNRFGKRYKLLTGQFRRQWVDWRVKQVNDLYADIQKTLRGDKNQWDLIVLTGRLPDSDYIRWMESKEKGGQADRVAEMFRLQGHDVSKLKKAGAIPVVFQELAGRKTMIDRHRHFDAARALPDFYWDKSLVELFQGSGAFMYMGFMFEGSIFPAKRHKLDWKEIRLVGYSAPQDSGFRTFVERSFGSVPPKVVLTGWSDITQMLGYDESMRYMVQKVQSLGN